MPRISVRVWFDEERVKMIIMILCYHVLKQTWPHLTLRTHLPRNLSSSRFLSNQVKMLFVVVTERQQESLQMID